MGQQACSSIKSTEPSHILVPAAARQELGHAFQRGFSTGITFLCLSTKKQTLFENTVLQQGHCHRRQMLSSDHKGKDRMVQILQIINNTVLQNSRFQEASKHIPDERRNPTPPLSRRHSCDKALSVPQKGGGWEKKRTKTLLKK